MSRNSHRLGGFAAAVLACACIGTAALAQTQGSGAPPESQGQPTGSGQATGPGYGMMGGNKGMGAGMMGGWGGPEGRWGGPKVSIDDRLAALKDELKITSGQTDAWNTYAAAVKAAESNFSDAMKGLWQPAGNGMMTPDQRFDAMTKMVAQMKQAYDQKKAAADALMPRLTQYQQGQASEILPGLAMNRDGHGCGMMGRGMMMDHGMMEQGGP